MTESMGKTMGMIVAKIVSMLLISLGVVATMGTGIFLASRLTGVPLWEIQKVTTPTLWWPQLIMAATFLIN